MFTNNFWNRWTTNRVHAKDTVYTAPRYDVRLSRGRVPERFLFHPRQQLPAPNQDCMWLTGARGQCCCRFGYRQRSSAICHRVVQGERAHSEKFNLETVIITACFVRPRQIQICIAGGHLKMEPKSVHQLQKGSRYCPTGTSLLLNWVRDC